MASPLRTLVLLAAAATSCLAQTNATTTTTSSASSSSTGTASSSITCATGIHLIVARGSSEKPGLGRIGVVAGNVTEAIPGSTVAAVDYPATFDAYLTSENLGVAAMYAMITSYVGACPDGKIALLGYSQGGQVAMDVVCGTTEAFFTVTPDLSAEYRKNIVAVVTFGDPSHLPGQPWDEGTSTHQGIFQRNNTADCEPYSPVIKGWCDTGDVYCDAGNITGVHGTYFANYTDDATNWIVSQFNASQAGNGTASPSGTGASPTASGTGSPSSSSPPTTTGAAGVLQPASLGLVSFLAVAGAAFGMLL